METALFVFGIIGVIASLFLNNLTSTPVSTMLTINLFYQTQQSQRI